MTIIAADKLTQKVTHPNVIEYTNFSEQYDLVETKIPSSWVGKSVAELNVRAKYGVNILAIRTGDTLNVTFDPNQPLQSRDSITIIADKKQKNTAAGLNYPPIVTTRTTLANTCIPLHFRVKLRKR